MTELGSGLQYTVYDIGNGRVRKIPTSFIKKLRILHSWGGNWNIFKHPFTNVSFCIRSSRTLVRSLGGLKKQAHVIDLSMLGNPTFLEGEQYEQDRAVTLGIVLKETANLAEQQELIDEYVALTRTCWTYGFGDTVFNFTVNNGVTPDGRVILIDLGELTWDKDELAQLLETRAWERHWSFASFESGSLKHYISRTCSAEFTRSRLQQCWNAVVVDDVRGSPT